MPIATDFLLTEDDDFILLESGEKVSLEVSYQGFPVLDVWMDWADYSPTQRSEQAGVILDNVTGLATWKPRGPFARAEMTMLFRVYGRPAISRFRKFVDALRGRQKPFWVPTWQQDLEPTGNITTANPFNIRNVGYTAGFYPYPQRRHLAIIHHDRTVYLREVTSASGGSPEVLVLNQGFSQTLLRDYTMISFLLLCRLKQDVVTYSYLNREIMECELPLIEVPQEYP